MKKILVLGGTGAMGTYLVPELIAMDYQVDVVALDGVNSNNPNFTYIHANAKDDAWLAGQLKQNYDAVVDFMLYSTDEFSKRHKLLLENTSHYIFFSTYRIYADNAPITENSPRLLDTSQDKEFLAGTDGEYSLYKAIQEDVLRTSGHHNFTIVRPSITYSKRRFQLVTLEADVVVHRAMKNQPVILPEEALSVQGTMSWAGDVARMIARLVLNPAAYQETFTLATAEHHTWGEIAEYYREIIGLTYIPVDAETYLALMGGTAGARYQLMYDRCFNRIVDNSKILRVTGMRQSELTILKDGLERELSVVPKDTVWPENAINARMDEFLKSEKSKERV